MAGGMGMGGHGAISGGSPKKVVDLFRTKKKSAPHPVSKVLKKK